MMWFKPPGEKHFDPVSISLAFAGLLVTSFLAGFVEEAQNYCSAAGRKAFLMLADAAQDLFANKKKEAEATEKDLNQIAEEATVIAKSITHAEFQHHISHAEDNLLLYLKKSGLDDDKATALAATVRHSTETHILRGRD